MPKEILKQWEERFKNLQVLNHESKRWNFSQGKKG